MLCESFNTHSMVDNFEGNRDYVPCAQAESLIALVKSSRSQAGNFLGKTCDLCVSA